MNPTELASMIVRLMGDSASYDKMIESAGTAIKGLADAATQSAAKIQGVNTAIKGLASAGVGLLAMFGIAGTLKGAFDSFMTLENIMLGLTAAIKSNGGSVEETMAKYNEWVGVITKLTAVNKFGALRILEAAEAMQFTGAAAVQVATNAVALAKGNEQLALSFVRVAGMMQRGHPEFAKRILGLQGITNKTELLIAIQKKLQTNMDIATARGASLTTQIDKLKISLAGFNQIVGKEIAGIIGPFVGGLTLMANAVKNLSPEMKKTIAYVILAVAAFLTLAPAITAVTYFFGPLIAVISSLISLITFLATSSVALFIAGIALMVAGILYLTGQGAELISWFGKQWSNLVEDVKIAVGGIADAIKAGDIELAWKIMWASVRLVWVKATQDLKELWIGFNVWMKETTVEVGTTVESLWGQTTGAIARRLIDLQEKLGKITAEQAEQMKQALGEINREEAKDLSDRKKRMLDQAHNEAMTEIKKIEDEIKALTKERDELVKEAADKAKDIKLPKLVVPPLPPIKQEVKLIPKFDATAFASAEAISRIQAFRDKLELQFQQKEGGEEGTTGKRFDTAASGSAEAGGRREGAETILKEIRDILKATGAKPGLPVIPAGLT